MRRYGLTGHVFGPANAYTSLALFNLLRMPLAFLPIMITSVINALVALTRIGDFLQKPESGLEALHKAAEATPTGHVKVRHISTVVVHIFAVGPGRGTMWAVAHFEDEELRLAASCTWYWWINWWFN